MKPPTRWAIVTVIFLAAGCTAGLRGQDSQTEDTGDDPSRGVARISVIQGEVNVKRGDSGDLVAAALNAPLLAQDHLQTSDGSRAEVQFDSANMVRLAPDTDVSLADIRYRHYQLQLATGTILYRVLRDSQADAEIDTPSISVRPAGRGAYRITVAGDGTTEVTVRSGQLTIYSPKGSETLNAGQTLLARGSNSDPEFQTEGEIARDQFDDWSGHRDQELLGSRSYQYVSTDIYGADDLDAYGSWVPSSYGTVWAPRVGSGWAPYHDGRWTWEDYYGWTWIDYNPWGWAPFHYGRWFLNGGAGWCWWPGARHQPYYWRPAIVGFFGFGVGGFGIGFGFGNVGWVPLAPYEAWHPWYGRGGYGRGGFGGRYGGNREFGNTAFINNANVYNTYRNARINNGVAYSTVNGFGRGGRSIYSASGAQIRNASLVRGQLPVAPQRSSLALASRGPAPMPQRFAAAGNQRFFTHQQPLAQRVPFAQQQQRMADVQQRTLGTRPEIGAGTRGQDAPAANEGFQRLGSTYGANSIAPGARGQQGLRSNGQVNNAPAQSGGWQRFGQGSSNAASRPSNPSSGGMQSFGRGASSNSGFGGGQVSRSPANSAPRASSGNDGGGWHRFGDPGASSSFRQSERAAPSGAGQNGWHSFGAPMDQAPRPNQSLGRGENGSGGFQQYSRPSPSYRNEQTMRTNPSIVHDRPSSAPRVSQPHYSSPSGAARSNGGGSRPSGGGGGHSGGGGGSHRR